MNQIFKKPIRFCAIIFLLLSSPFFINAQTHDPLLKKIYLQAAGGGNTNRGDHGEIGLQTIFKNKWSGTISYHSLVMEPKNLPSDYVAGSGVVFFLFPYVDNADVEMELYSLTAGRYFQTGKKSWITTEAGISIVKGETVSFERRPVTSTDSWGMLFGVSSTSSNYTTTFENKSAVGAMVRADYNWAFSRFCGLGAGVFANFNSIQSPLGFNLKLTMGFMRSKAKRKQPANPVNS